MIQRDLTILLQPPTYILLKLHIILISLIIYKPSILIISSRTFSIQLGAGISLFCLSQCMNPFCTLSPWLAAHNPEINWKTGEVKMMRCPPLCGRRSPKKEKVKRVVTLEEEKIVRWVIDNKEDWRKEEKIEKDHRKIKEMVPKRFLK